MALSQSQLRITGLPELLTALRELPETLQAEAGAIVHAHAEEMARQATAVYASHTVTGNLAGHVRVELGRDAVSVSARVKATAHHAYIFEHGTKLRRHANGHEVGSMPAFHAFIPIAIRQRQIMVRALADLLKREGLEVVGTVA